MSKIMIAIVGFIYAYIAAESAWRGNAPTAIVFAGYAAANAGLWLMVD